MATSVASVAPVRDRSASPITCLSRSIAAPTSARTSYPLDLCRLIRPCSEEAYIKVNGHWCYLYRATDRSGALVDVRLSEMRHMAAKAFFRSAKAVTGVIPARVTTDGHDSYPHAICTELDNGVKHRTNRYLNSRIEQDHRGIKGRYAPMRGFKSHTSATPP
jgi:transposase-like protein